MKKISIIKVSCLSFAFVIAFVLLSCSDNNTTTKSTTSTQDSTTVKKDSTVKQNENSAEPGALNGQY